MRLALAIHFVCKLLTNDSGNSLHESSHCECLSYGVDGIEKLCGELEKGR